MSGQSFEPHHLQSDDESNSFEYLIRHLQGLLEKHSPNSPTCINFCLLIENQINRNTTNLIYKNQQFNQGGAKQILGSLMSQGGNRERDSRLRQLNGASRSIADRNTDAYEEQGQEGSSPSAESYDEQEADWFATGRYLKISARRADGHIEQEIHEREFIILDSKNTKGKGVRVDYLPKLDSGWARNKVAILEPEGDDSGEDEKETARTSINERSSGASSKWKPIRLQAFGSHEPDMKDRYARLDHTYNIPFAQYKCKDLGILSKESLAALRLRYIQYLTNEWDLERQVLESLSTSAKDSNSIASTSSVGSLNKSRNTQGRKRGES